MIIIKKYKEIKKIYGISNITDSYIEILLNKAKKFVYIYEIDPVTILSLDNFDMRNISNVYIEFLREFNLDYQILIRNQKLNIHKYIDEYTRIINIESDENMLDIYTRYINDIKEKLEEENIYYTKYYVITSIRDLDNSKIEDIDRIMYKINKIGCNVKRVEGKNNLENILYECMNKEVLVR